MSHFYGTVQGSRGVASRTGGKSGGMRATAASWSGSIRVELRHDDETGKDHFRVVQSTWHGHGISEVLATGVIGEPSGKP
jgi:hypothetical protein